MCGFTGVGVGAFPSFVACEKICEGQSANTAGRRGNAIRWLTVRWRHRTYAKALPRLSKPFFFSLSYFLTH